jgi:hypothetical protein
MSVSLPYMFHFRTWAFPMIYLWPDGPFKIEFFPSKFLIFATFLMSSFQSSVNTLQLLFLKVNTCVSVLVYIVYMFDYAHCF